MNVYLFLYKLMYRKTLEVIYHNFNNFWVAGVMHDLHFLILFYFCCFTKSYKFINIIYSNIYQFQVGLFQSQIRNHNIQH